MASAESPISVSYSPQTQIRVQAVTRGYWPLADESCQRLMQNLDAWKSMGIEPSVLTTRWNPAWPDRATLRNIPIERLLPAPTSSWNESHLQKNIAKWLFKNAECYDVIYVDAADSLLPAIVSKSSSIGKPVICRFSQEPVLSPKPRSLGSYLPTSVSIRESLRKCHRVVADHRQGYEALLELGLSKEQCVWIPDAVFQQVGRSAPERSMALHALFQASGDLAVPTQSHLLVHFGEASMDQLEWVLRSVCDLLDRGVPVRMWLVNPGPDVPKIYEWLKFQGWHHEILLFDGFDVLEDLICIADLVIASNPARSLQHSTRLALESHVPLIVALDPSVADWMPETPLMKWYHSRETLAGQFADFLTHRSQWQAESIALRRHYQRHHPNENWLGRWSSIFAQAVSRAEIALAEKRIK